MGYYNKLSFEKIDKKLAEFSSAYQKESIDRQKTLELKRASAKEDCSSSLITYLGLWAERTHLDTKLASLQIDALLYVRQIKQMQEQKEDPSKVGILVQRAKALKTDMDKLVEEINNYKTEMNSVGFSRCGQKEVEMLEPFCQTLQYKSGGKK